MKVKAILQLPTYTKGRGVKKKTNLFSMNIYRNMHYLSLNKVKQDYHEVVREWAGTLPKYKTIFPKYKIYFKGKRKKDKSALITTLFSRERWAVGFSRGGIKTRYILLACLSVA